MALTCHLYHCVRILAVFLREFTLLPFLNSFLESVLWGPLPVPKAMRETLSERGYTVGRMPVHHVAASADGTAKVGQENPPNLEETTKNLSPNLFVEIRSF